MTLSSVHARVAAELLDGHRPPRRLAPSHGAQHGEVLAGAGARDRVRLPVGGPHHRQAVRADGGPRAVQLRHERGQLRLVLAFQPRVDVAAAVDAQHARRARGLGAPVVGLEPLPERPRRGAMGGVRGRRKGVLHLEVRRPPAADRRDRCRRGGCGRDRRHVVRQVDGDGVVGKGLAVALVLRPRLVRGARVRERHEVLRGPDGFQAAADVAVLVRRQVRAFAHGQANGRRARLRDGRGPAGGVLAGGQPGDQRQGEGKYAAPEGGGAGMGDGSAIPVDRHGVVRLDVRTAAGDVARPSQAQRAFASVSYSRPIRSG